MNKPRLSPKKISPVFLTAVWVGNAFLVASYTIGAYVDSK